MFFQISPVVRKKTKRVVQKDRNMEDTKIEILSLAPFTPIPKITFDDVLVGTSQSRKLLIQNPTQQGIKLFVTKTLPEELCFTVNWSETYIEAGSEKILEMTWNAISEEAGRYSFTLSDGKRINRSIGVTLKSAATKKISAKITKNKPKKPLQKSPIKLPLSRKPISPIKKFKSNRSSPVKYYTSTYSSPKSHREQQTSYISDISPKTHYSRLINRENEFKDRSPTKSNNYLSPKNYYEQQVCYKRTNKYVSPKENGFKGSSNKENRLSPNQPYFLSSTASSFVSPNSVNFSLQSEERFEKRDTYVFSSAQTERRETFSIQNVVLNVENVGFEKLLENETFDVKLDDSPVFRDSLDPPNQVLPLREQNRRNGENLEQTGTVRKRVFSNFEYNLKNTDSFVLSPIIDPKQQALNKFSPSFCSRDHSQETELQISSATFKLNVSSETYVKGSNSPNLSGVTYVKDASVGDIARLEESSVSSKTAQSKSPIFLKPNSFDFGESNANGVETRKQQHLSSIAEESAVFSEGSFRNTLKRKSPDVSNYSFKRGRISTDPKTDWSKRSSSAFRISKSTSGLNLRQFATNQDKNQQLMSTITETSEKSVIVRNPFLYSNVIDPFISSSVYSTEEWVDKQEIRFKKWLNVLLTPPEELSVKTEIDAAKIWQECKKKDIAEAPSKETVSFNYNVNSKLVHLRKQAQTLFRSKELGEVLQRVCDVVEWGKLSIRDDKDVHLNLKLKSDIMGLILGYNPLWLRIGLETIYNEVIPLKTNSDVSGLAHFIMERFFKDPYLMKKHKTPYAPKYSSDLKKFILKKFLILVYFLDVAKNAKLIQHDPCLFCKNASEKDSKSVLTHFARETLSAVGDITKYLKSKGYVVTHVQSYIHEFDYAVKNLGVDLRDGVRLTKVMEILQMRSDLTSKLRVPAISRLQKVHNMQLVFESLKQTGFEILYDISPKDIVDGHKENTLSFLWQIIYKFEAPLMVTKATSIQQWFRSLPVVLKRRKLQKVRELRESAVRKIQAWFRRQKLSQTYFVLSEFVRNHIEECRRLKAVIKIQSLFRMIIAKRRYTIQHNVITKLQAYAKGWLIRNNYHQRITAARIIQKNFKTYIARKRFLKFKNAVVFIQRKFRANQQCKIEKNNFVLLILSTSVIQKRFRAYLEMKKYRSEYLQMRKSAIMLQSYYRMSVMRRRFLLIRNAVITVQNWYRSVSQMKTVRKQYKDTKKAVLLIEQTYLSITMMRLDRSNYEMKRNAVLKIQEYYRAWIKMKADKEAFLKLRSSVICIQQRYRAYKLMESQRQSYQKLREVVQFTQSRYRANKAMVAQRNEYIKQRTAAQSIQKWYKATIEMKKCRSQFVSLKLAAVVIQEKYRANKKMEKEKIKFQTMKKASIKIQQKYRATLMMREERYNFLHLKNCITEIQERFRANRLAKLERNNYINLRNATILVQRKYRAQKTMLTARNEYQTIRNAVLSVQHRYRANKLMQTARNSYIKLKNAVIVLQRRYRAQKLMLYQKQTYEDLRNASIFVQRRFRQNVLFKFERTHYLKVIKSVLVIQRQFRAQMEMRNVREEYLLLRNVTIVVQRRFRSLVLMRNTREEFLALKKATKTIQRRYRAQRAMIKQKEYYQKLQSLVILIQQKYRAKKLGASQRTQFLALKRNALLIQKSYRANKIRNKYLALRNAVINIQRRFRAQICMREQKRYYDKLHKEIMTVQQRFRAKKLGIIARTQYVALRKTAIFIQSHFRANKVRCRYLALRNAALVIQRRYRALILMRKERTYYQMLRRHVMIIQQRFRARKIGGIARTQYVARRKTAILIQSHFRANKVRCRYLALRNAALVIQRRYRALLLMRKKRTYYQMLRRDVMIIQQRFRARKLGGIARTQYVALRKTAILIQSHFRANKVRSIYLALRNAALVIQRRYRALISMRKGRTCYQMLRRDVMIIQQRFRARKLGGIARTQYVALRKTAILIQSHFRANKVRSRYLALRNAALVIQRRYRAIISMRKEITYYQMLRRDVVIIQQRFRAIKLGNAVRSRYEALRKSALLIQRRYRANKSMVKQVEVYSRIKWAALVLQSRYRAQRAMRDEMEKYRKLRHATFVIQRKWKATILSKEMRIKFLMFKKSVMTVQVFYRAYMKMKQERLAFLDKYKAVTGIQRLARGYLARKKYSPMLLPEAVQARKVLKVQNAAAVKIQASWKGYSVRKSNIPVMTALRRLRNGNPEYPRPSIQSGKTLGQRCEMAMLCMTSKNSSLLMIIKALEDLDFITRHCQNICISMSFLLPNQLYIIIASAARSRPEMIACNMATFILINFYKYKETRSHSWDPEYLDPMINVLLHWCDKEAPLFSTLCTLLWLFAHEEPWKKVIQNLPNIRQRFSKIQTLVHRKESMVLKTKRLASVPSVFGPLENTQLPTRDAKWGLDYARPNTFTNAVFACSSLIKILELSE
ncbi:abnormal spindle-like microcephaly-associated protein homolog isoform X2 [Sitophilus oryzae]|uniref:Abnormal spindle-like microcephaly-associated protein homolog isoform X2 n=1 Tax=Sitophilus oryzae TaxID=7048 RepID=A0A6J2XQ85_SITOR|nr:abnormal spindle-like microcephaly-associated protein homolog isoform X2 [Sitophilus oryzae]